MEYKGQEQSNGFSLCPKKPAFIVYFLQGQYPTVEGTVHLHKHLCNVKKVMSCTKT